MNKREIRENRYFDLLRRVNLPYKYLLKKAQIIKVKIRYFFEDKMCEIEMGCP